MLVKLKKKTESLQQKKGEGGTEKGLWLRIQMQSKWLNFKGTEYLSEVLRALEPESYSVQL